MEELVGRTLGQGEYRLVARLGMGGMGAVYEAEQTRLRRRVAVKVLWPHLTQEPGLAVRFNREARIAARLEHPHILPVYGFGEESGLLYLVMRLVRGGSLKDRLRGEGLRRQGWSPQEALELARQVLPPLDYAHRQGVVHRDLKPDNILLEPSDEFSTGYRVFLSDFGIATLAQGDEVDSGLTQTGGALGTPAYMAPEQVLDQHVDGRADLYAFGVVLFEVLVGQVPYRGHTPLAVAMQHVREPLPSPRELNSRLPARVEAVLLRALAKARDDRFPSGAALIDALTQAVERSATEPQPGQIAGRAPASPTRHGRSSSLPPARPAPPAEMSAQANPPPPSHPGVARANAIGSRGAVIRPTSASSPAATPPVDSPTTVARPRVSTRRRGRRVLMLAGAALLVGILALAAGLIGSGAFVTPQAQPTPPAPTVDLATAPPASPASPPDPRPWIVPPSDLGPGWTVTRESTAGSTAQLGVYEVEYAEAGGTPGTRGFSLFSASTVADADAGLQQLRRSAEGRGVIFETVPGFAQSEPAWRGRAILDGARPRVSIVYDFRVNTVVAIVEAIGAADLEASLGNAAEHAAQLQRGRLVAVLNQ